MTGDFVVLHYRCASCWGLLVQRYRDGIGWVVECAGAGSEHSGFVTASFVNYRRSISNIEYSEVRDIYAEMFGLKRAHLPDMSAALYGSHESL